MSLTGPIKWSGKEPTRKFGGLLTSPEIEKAVKEKYPDAPDDEILLRIKMEEVYQREHLKAYLAGKKTFTLGYDNKNKPMEWDVESIWE